MLFITNRLPIQNIRSEENRRFEFDLDNNAVANSVFFCNREAAHTYTEILSLQFFRRIKSVAYDEILLYIHGFSNLPEAVFSAAEELQHLFDEKRRGRCWLFH